MPKQPLCDDERQAYVDNLSPDQVNPDAQETFEDTSDLHSDTSHQ